jgi:signal transduction histidine kinase
MPSEDGGEGRTASAGPEAAGKPRLLVVDDERGIRDLLVYDLASRGVEVTVAPDGPAGLALAREREFDAAVVDMTMPQMNGLEVLRGLKSVQPRLAVIMMTGHATLETAVESMKAGAYDYITKPFQTDDLFRLIGRALEHKRLSHEVNHLQELNRLKSEFLANMSHELRTPMNAIIGYTSLILEKTYGDVTAGQAQGLKRVEANAKNLLDIINNILDYSKLAAGRMPVYWETCDVSALVAEVTETMESLSREKKLRLTAEAAPGLRVRTDKTKLKQVLINLVGNALKFTREGSVTVRAATVGEEVRLEVEDTGIGIPEKDIPLLFQEFKQLDASSTREFGGTGLGLSISKRLVELLGGRIEVESVPGKGATFRVVLPAAAGDAAAAVDKPAVVPADLAGRRVLLAIDDDPEVLLLLRENLQGTGYAFVGAQSADEGIALARQLRPCVITLDIMMPHRDGWSVLQALKNDRDLRSIPVIIVSIVENRQLGFSLGVTDYIVKPFNRQVLLEKLKNLENAPPKRVLVVDDDEFVTELFLEVLKERGYQVETVNDGKKAVERIIESKPDILFLDLMMPTVNGFDVLEAMDRDPALRKTRVFVITAKNLTAKETEYLEKRVELVVNKGSKSVGSIIDVLRERLSDLNATGVGP